MAVILPPLSTNAEEAANASNDTLAVERISDLWFEDGSLVIQAGRKEFRVFRSVLTAKSSVFRDMASFPSPSYPGAEDRVSTVVLHDDPDEVEAFLRAIFDSSYFESYPADVSSPALIGIARLSHKYDVPYLRRRAFTHLNAVVPASAQDTESHIGFKGFDAVTDFFYNIQLPPNQSKKQSAKEVLHFSLSFIQLAREINALWLLPWAYFSAACVRDVEATLQSSISFEDKCVVLNWHTRHKDIVVDIATAFDHSPNPAVICDADSCRKSKSRARTSLMQSLRSDISNFNTVHYAWRYTVVHLCSACSKDIENKVSDKLGTWWKSLPSKCKLECWEKLLELRERESKEP